MSTGTELLAAVVARLDDDGPRLVYADWLSERGDPRGEFIALQCELARASPRSTRHAELQAKLRALRPAHGESWEPQQLGPDVRWGVRRGFAWTVSAPASRLLALGDSLLDAAPTLEAVTVSRFDVTAAAFLAWPLLPRFADVALHYLPGPQGPPGGPGPDRVALLSSLLGDARLQHVRRLSISYSYLDLPSWQAIAGSPLLPRLDSLSLGLCNARDDSVAALMAAPSSLAHLSLANGQLGTAGVVALAGSPHARTLRSLDLSWNRLGIKATQALAASELLGQLEVLDLSHCQPGDAGCAALASGKLGALKELRLGAARVSDAGIEALLGSKALPALEVVDLGHETRTRAAPLSTRPGGRERMPP